MGRYVIRRLLQFIPVLFLGSIAIWAIIYAAPGDPALAIAGADATQAEIDATRERLGLDRPIHEQYLRWVGSVLQGDLGKSITNGGSIAGQLAARLPASLQLAVSALLIGMIIALPIGLYKALLPRSPLTRMIDAYQVLALAVPHFWVAILLILVLTINARVLPSISDYVPFWKDPGLAFRNTILPALALAFYLSSVFSRFVSTSVEDALGEDYVRTARAKGLLEPSVILRHALRNALLPIVTVIGLQLGGLIGGAIVIEAVFNYPGVGRLIYTAVSARDYPTIQATVLVVMLAFLSINLVIDVLYAWLDPRIRLE